jgi:hypothetical protein
LLSHDLLEGSYVRVGLATDIELLDVFPSSYIAWWNRQHRWIRGDWQIIDWLKPRVPVGSVVKLTFLEKKQMEGGKTFNDFAVAIAR